MTPGARPNQVKVQLQHPAADYTKLRTQHQCCLSWGVTYSTIGAVRLYLQMITSLQGHRWLEQYGPAQNKAPQIWGRKLSGQTAFEYQKPIA